MKNKQNNEVFELIKSLNKSQKLLLSRKWSKLPYSSFLYVQVYNILLTYKSFNSNALLRDVAGLKSHQLANIQKELYVKILDHLRAQQAPTPFEEYRILLKNHTILRGLNLPEQAEKWKKKAVNFKASNPIIQDAILVDEETYYYETMSKLDWVSQIMRANDVNPLTKQLMDGYLRFRQFYLVHRFSKNEAEYTALESELHHILIEVDYSELALHDRIVYNRMLYHYYYIQRDFVRGYKYATRLITIYEKFELNTFYKEVYLKLLHYQLMCLFRLNAAKKYTQLLTKFKSISLESNLPDINMLNETHFKYSTTHGLNLHLIKGEFAAGLKLFESLLRSFNKLDIKHSSGYVNSIYYKVACLHFGNENFRACIAYLDKIIYSVDISERPDLQTFSRILKLTSLFELQETEYIYENIRSVYGYLARNKQLDKFQIEIMQFLRVCATLPTIEIKQELRNLRTAMYLLAQDKFEQRPFFYFDIIGWLDSKLEQKSLSATIKERGLGHRIMY